MTHFRQGVATTMYIKFPAKDQFTRYSRKNHILLESNLSAHNDLRIHVHVAEDRNDDRVSYCIMHTLYNTESWME